MKIEMVRKAQGAQPALFLVKRDGFILGQLEKYRDTRSETHPWKAFVGTGMSCKYLGAFYGDNGPSGVVHHIDPKQAAIDAITEFYAVFEPIAKKAGFETLVTRNRDRLDFTEISASAMLAALHEAFEIGVKTTIIKDTNAHLRR